MLKWYIVTFFMYLTQSYAHRDKLAVEADLQTALMPQELNPIFVPGKQQDAWKALAPFRRDRRDTNEVNTPADNHTNVASQVKWYSRVIAVVAFCIAAVIEVILYVMQMYSLT